MIETTPYSTSFFGNYSVKSLRCERPGCDHRPGIQEMGAKQKKGKEGIAVDYIQRGRALRKLQLNLPDFRRLCILKGIYPRDPPHKNKIRGATANPSTVYLTKDINYLSHEPLLQKFRALKAFHKRLRKYVGKKDWSKIRSLEKNARPEIRLDHLVRERYPTFADALRDLDDPLSMIALFSTLPKNVIMPRSGIKSASSSVDHREESVSVSEECAALMRQFEAYVSITGSLKRSFISIKGIYYQAIIMSETVTWVVPHETAAVSVPSEVDFSVMRTFLEFYMTLVRFVNFRLYARLSWVYPPSFINVNDDREGAISRDQFPPIGEDAPITLDQSSVNNMALKGQKIFLSREVPLKTLSFIANALGADSVIVSTPASNAEEDPEISLHVIDRPIVPRTFAGRRYVQPQYLFDLLNANYISKDIETIDPVLYGIGAVLPPHLSPFDADLADEAAIEEEAAEMNDISAPEAFVDVQKQAPKKRSKEQKELALALLTKKRMKLHKRLESEETIKMDKKRFLAEKRAKIAAAKADRK